MVQSNARSEKATRLAGLDKGLSKRSSEVTAAWNSATREDLLRWADDEASPARLPELVRRLVLETADGVELIDFPGGSAVTTGGFDGHVRASGATAFVPAGSSVWELSIRKTRPTEKADEDYEKRLQTPDGSPMADATYMQVIARPWKNASAWATGRSAEKRWRLVRAHNVDWLTTWLEQAPATRMWLLGLLGKAPLGAVPAERWWEQWTNATRPPLTPEVVLARAGASVSTLDQHLRSRGLTTVSGPIGTDELIACSVALAVRADDDLLARAVVVNELDSLRRLLSEPHPLVLILRDAVLANEVGVETAHSVIVPVPVGDLADVVLEPVETATVVEAIRRLDAEAPYDLGVLARRSFPALRRRLAMRQELMAPEWATGAISSAVRAAMLLTSWHDASAADRDVLAALAGTTYEEAREQLRQFTLGDDPLLALTDQRWHVVSPVDAWLLLGRHLLRDDLVRFCQHVANVLGEIDPALSLPPGDRWRASLDGKVLRHSQNLRAGIASSLALLATHGDTVVAGTGLHGERWAAGVVRRLLKAANEHGSLDRWESVASELPRLAEAAPLEVIEALRGGLTGEPAVLAGVFKDDPSTDHLFGPGSPHTHFLWALETLAWSAEYLGAASEVLASLATIDPGGRLSNRPGASLANIFCAWHPDTAADADQRLRVVDRLRDRWPDVAWRLKLDLLPNNTGIHMSTHSPDFRDWKPSQAPTTRVAYWRMIDELVARLLIDADGNTQRWLDLLEAHQHLHVEGRSSVRDALSGLDPSTIDEPARHVVWEALRRMVAHHREYADAKWALPSEEVAWLDVLAAKFAPVRPELRHAWLFDSGWVELGDLRRRDDYRAYEAELAVRRAAAIAEIYEDGGLDAVAQFARGRQAGFVGVGLADTIDEPLADELVWWLAADEETKRQVANAYIWRMCRSGELPWALAVLDRHKELPAHVQGAVLLCVPDSLAAAEVAATRGPEVEQEFWKAFLYVGRGDDFEHVLFVAEKLMSVGRWAGTLDMLALYAREDRVDEDYAQAVAGAFEGLIASRAEDAESDALATWDFERLFRCLDQHVEVIGVDRITRIQWYFLPALGFDPPTNLLHRRLADDPAFFSEIVALNYRPHHRDPDLDDQQPPDEVVEARARNAHVLLDSWRLPPGTSSDGEFNAESCEKWINQAVALLTASDRLDVGKRHIGRALAHTPPGPDGWPRNDVASLIGRLDDDHIDRGLQLRIHNERGVTSRGLADGGDQERELAAKYRTAAGRFSGTEPRVAALLKAVAESYEDEARHHDANAERHLRGLDL